MNRNQRKRALEEQYRQKQQLETYMANKKRAKQPDTLDRIQQGAGNIYNVAKKLNNARGYGNNISNFGNRLSSLGTNMQNSNNGVLSGLGSKANNLGGRISSFGNTLSSMNGGSQAGAGANTLGNTMSNAGSLASNAGTATQTGAQAAQGASQGAQAASSAASSAGSAASSAGKAVPVAGAALGGLSALNNFRKGDNVNGAMDATAAAASFIPVYGWAVAGAIKVAQMLRNAMNKKKAEEKQKTVQATQRAIQQTEKEDQEKTQEALSNIAEIGQNGGQPETIMQAPQPQNVQTQNQQNQPSYEMLPDNTQQQQQEQQAPQDNMAMQPNNNQVNVPQDNTQNTAEAIMNDYLAKKNEENNSNNFDMSSIFNLLPPAIKGTLTDKVNQTISDKTGLDYKPIDFSGNNNSGTVTGGAAPVTTQQPIQGNVVQNQAQSNAPQVTQQQTQDPNATQQQPAFGERVYNTSNPNSRAAQILEQFKQGYKDNTENTLGNTYFAPGQQKTFANRLGEALGTGQRIASHPLTQAAIATGLDYYNGNNIGNALLTGINYGQQKAASDRYEQEVNGGNRRSMFGGYTPQDVAVKRAKDKMIQDQANWQANYDQKEAENQRNYDFKVAQQKAMEDYRKQQLETRKAYQNAMLALRKQDIENRKKGVGGYGRSGSYDPTLDPNFYDDYDQFEQFDNLEEGTDAYNQEVDDMLQQMYGGKTPGSAWGYYSAQERANAKNEVDKIINQQKRQFMKKYHINPMKSKGSKK